jgi:hypothetical protein
MLWTHVTNVMRLSDWQLGHLKWHLQNPNFWLGGRKARAKPSLTCDQLYTSEGVDFSKILRPEGPQDFRAFILQGTLQAASEKFGRKTCVTH